MQIANMIEKKSFRPQFPVCRKLPANSLNHTPKSCSRKALFSCDWIFQEKELRFRLRSWQVNTGGRAPMNYDSLYPTFCPAAQA